MHAPDHSKSNWNQGAPTIAARRYYVHHDIEADGGHVYGVIDTRTLQRLSAYRGQDAKASAARDAHERNQRDAHARRTARQADLLPYAAASDAAAEKGQDQ